MLGYLICKKTFATDLRLNIQLESKFDALGDALPFMCYGWTVRYTVDAKPPDAFLSIIFDKMNQNERILFSCFFFI